MSTSLKGVFQQGTLFKSLQKICGHLSWKNRNSKRKNFRKVKKFSPKKCSIDVLNMVSLSRAFLWLQRQERDELQVEKIMKNLKLPK
jgi:hypothetical protein